MDKKRLQHTALSTVVFTIVFAIFVVYFGMESIKTTESKIAAIIIGSIIFFGVSYFLRKGKF